MFSEIRRKQKKKQEKKADVLRSISNDSENTTSSGPTIGYQSTSHDDEIHGVELNEYAKKRDLTREQVWHQIRRGDLVARSENGFLYVYGKNAEQPLSLKEPRLGTSTKNEDASSLNLSQKTGGSHLPPVPADVDLPDVVTRSKSPEVALLLENLIQAKEEQKEILQFSQRSIEQITTLSQETIASKNAVIDEKNRSLTSKNSEISSLKEKLADQEQKLRKLQQEKEDLEILTGILSQEPKENS